MTLRRALVPFGVGVLLAASTPALGSAEAADQKRDNVGLTLTKITPSPALHDGQKVNITGTVANNGGQPITGVTVRLRYGTHPISSRGLLTQQAQPAAKVTDPTFTFPSVAANSSGAWHLQLPAADLVGPAKELGVYPLEITAVDAAGRSLGEQSTFVVYTPKNSFAKNTAYSPLKVAWVVPLTAAPRRTDEAGDATPTFQNDQLNAELDTTGRLGGLASAGSQARVPVTWAIDPSLLADAQDMTKPYEAAGDKKPASTTAQSWLATVKSGGSQYFDLPFADPDAAALVRQRQRPRLQTAYDRAADLGPRIMGRKPDLAVAWPADGAADARTLGVMAATGKTQGALLSSGQLASTVPGETYTPSATALAAGRKALAYDATISQVISQNTTAPTAKVKAEQRFLAETALTAIEQPGLAQRSLVIAPDRDWSPGSGFAADLLDLTAKAPWLSGTRLGDLLNAKATSNRQLGSYPQAVHKRELSKEYLKGVADLGKSADGLKTIYPQPHDDFQDAVLRATSSWWRGNGAQADKFKASVASAMNDVEGNIKILANKTAAIAGRSGKVPFTVQNGLDTPIKVRLIVTSGYSNRLEVGDYSQDITIDPKTAHGVYFTVKALANGTVPVHLQLRTVDGKADIGGSATIYVRTTGYLTTALVIVGVALAVLFVGVGVRGKRARDRRKRAARAEDVDEPAAGDQGASHNAPTG